jgi:hypothetical protein
MPSRRFFVVGAGALEPTDRSPPPMGSGVQGPKRALLCWHGSSCPLRIWSRGSLYI